MSEVNVVCDIDDTSASENLKAIKTSSGEELRIFATSRIIKEILCPKTEVIAWKSKINFSPRSLYFTSSAWSEFLEEKIQIQAQIANAADYWVEGGKCDSSLKKEKEEGRFLKRLKPEIDEIWEIRVTNPPRNQTRLLGRFIFPNKFIVCLVVKRDVVDKKWELAKTLTKASWNALNIRACFHSNDLYAYLRETEHDNYPI
ncbi:hypothetical protein FAI41_02160 [Acetobacteraceae bacterium]|nr:hypothetical protein FAI41_02160 [Acetobacteraceae bacterium]